jgi:hypothetical protein
VIGLFGLIGMLGVCTAPFVGRAVDGFVPWMATLVALAFFIVSQAIQTAAGQLSIGAVVVATLRKRTICEAINELTSVPTVLDIGVQACQVSVTTNVFR